ncbi:MAG: Na+/H+ antiporter subunit E [Hyphomicrobiaceae bacterium]|nr:Na+/H+ antiporter subunit E [Hyphomicrobiaceae bacterium]MCC0023151.1 Na+/H+ antiporter subunit E [Hyphomicrobiaceae bacterium]
MNFAMVSLILALVWVAITGNFSAPNLLMGWLISLLAMWVVRNQMTTPILVSRMRRVIGLILLFLYELVLSAFRVARLVLTPNIRSRLKPGIVAFPVTAKSDVEITLLANLITLTPGTLSVDVSEDRSVIYVHCISVDDKQDVIRDIAEGFEAKIIEVFE